MNEPLVMFLAVLIGMVAIAAVIIPQVLLVFAPLLTALGGAS